MTALRTFPAAASGATAVEFAFIAPMFLAFVFGILQGGVLLWTQTGLQHATEQAARCATVNATLCGTPTRVQSFAASQALGRTLPATAFTVAVTGCGNQVTGTYGAQFFTYPMTLSATSCFPK